MQTTRSSTTIAREALKQLALRKIAPTPDNFRQVYDEIAGLPTGDAASGMARALDRVLREAGRQRPRYLKAANEIAAAVERRDWEEVEQQLQELLPAAASASWAGVVRNLLRQLEVSHKGLPPGRKKEALERVLANFEHDPEQLAQKIQALVASWSRAAQVERGVDGIEAPAAAESMQAAAAPGEWQEVAPAALWRDLLMRTLEFSLQSQFRHAPALSAAAENLLQLARSAHTEQQLAQLADAFKAFWHALQLNGDAQSRLHQALLDMLRLLMDNMGELVMDDQWLAGQARMIRDIMAHPLDIGVLYDAESSLKELIYKQGKLKFGLNEARDTLKLMAATFAERLAFMSENTGEFHGKIGAYQQQISDTEDIVELNVILEGLMSDTRTMQLDSQRAHAELKDARSKVEQAEQRVRQLTAELEQASELAQQDFLTGALNRRGMNEALQREFSRTDRSGAPMSLALMDIDHFKKLNDALGHDVGDDALTYLAGVTQGALRPADVLARYGGEEFVIILPDTTEEQGVQVMARVQRELTKNFFLHRNERILITFSAGVAQRVAGETAEVLLKRADAALYRAKHAGRNRVIGANLP
jgi:diguanylate cyclase